MSRRRTISASAEEVWRLLTDFEEWPKWGPTVSGVESDASAVGEGVTGWVVTPVGVKLPFEIDTFEPGVFWDWTVGGVKATGHLLRPVGEQSCEVEFTVRTLFYPYVVVLNEGLRRLDRLATG